MAEAEDGEKKKGFVRDKYVLRGAGRERKCTDREERKIYLLILMAKVR
jgi:hypothetical protein